jgi:hypothetical protein
MAGPESVGYLNTGDDAPCIDDDIMQVDRIVGRVLRNDETETTLNPDPGTMTWTLDDATLMWSRS